MTTNGTLITRRSMLPLEAMGEFYQAVAQVPFAIQGIAAWNTELGDTFEQMQVGHTMVSAGGGWVPAQFYAMPEGWGYAAFALALERGDVLPLSWGPEYFLSPGNMFRIRVKRNGAPNPNLAVVIWGYQLVAFSDEALTSFPDVSYFDLLEKERGFLQTRLTEIDETLTRVGGKPKDDKAEAPAALPEPEPTKAIWRCQSCGLTDEKTPMPADREAYYANPKARKCPRCKTEDMSPEGF
jgi:hypothetical protein